MEETTRRWYPSVNETHAEHHASPHEHDGTSAASALFWVVRVEWLKIRVKMLVSFLIYR